MSDEDELRAALLSQLETVTSAMQEDAEQVVVVGGMAALFYTSAVRVTEDIDCMVSLDRAGYYQLADRLRSRGFRESKELTCRWRYPRPGGEPLSLDLVPTDASLLGFSSRWYAEAFPHARTFALASGRLVRVIDPVYLVATKLEAFRSRGQGDFRGSHDLEDLVAVLAASTDVRARVQSSEEPVCVAVREELRAIRDELLPRLDGHLTPRERETVADELHAWLLAL